MLLQWGSWGPSLAHGALAVPPLPSVQHHCVCPEATTSCWGGEGAPFPTPVSLSAPLSLRSFSPGKYCHSSILWKPGEEGGWVSEEPRQVLPQPPPIFLLIPLGVSCFSTLSGGNSSNFIPSVSLRHSLLYLLLHKKPPSGLKQQTCVYLFMSLWASWTVSSLALLGSLCLW